MKFFKRTFILILFFLFALNFKVVNAVETIDFDISQIANNFNNSSYISEFNNIGIDVHAIQNDNSITLYYNNESLVCEYDKTSESFSINYPYSPSGKRKIYDILTALLVDTVAVMQGNDEGIFLPFALSDSFCLSFSRDLGLEKNYLGSGNGNNSTYVSFTIVPNVLFEPPSTSAEIDLNSFYSAYETFYTTDDCIVTQENLFFYKTYTDDGLMEIYVGEPNELSSFSYNSFLNAISILFTKQDTVCQEVIKYVSDNYSDFSNGNFEFDGITIETDDVKLPIKNEQTILTSKNMKYAKITIDENIVNEKIKDIVIETDDPNSQETKKGLSSEKIVPLIVSFVIVFIISVMIIAAFFLIKH